MEFKEWLSFNEAKRISSDRDVYKKEIINGVHVYFYNDDIVDKQSTFVILKQYIPDTIKAIDKFLDRIDAPQDFAKRILDRVRSNSRVSYNQLTLVEVEYGKLDKQYREKINQFISLDVLGAIYEDLGINEFMTKYVRIPLVNDFNESLTPLENLRRLLINLHPEMVKQLNSEAVYLNGFMNSIEDSIEIKRRNRDKLIETTKIAIKGAITKLKVLGVRKMVLPPIKIRYVSVLPPGFGGVTKRASAEIGERGKSSSTHEIIVYIANQINEDELEKIIIHEYGHILFYSSKELQEVVAKLIKIAPASSRYGDIDYIYPEYDEPIVHHSSGNEWTAELLIALAFGEIPRGFTIQHIREFKRALATVDLHPHAGIGYRLGQDK